MDIYGLEKMSLVDYSGYVACTVFTNGCNFRCPFCHNAGLVTGKNTPEKIDKEEFFDFLQKRKNYLDAVCITGGEPTLNRDLPEFIQQIRSFGYRVKLDSNGTNPTMLRTLIDNKLIDYLAMDIKNSPEKYGLTVGIFEYDLTKVKESIAILQERKIPFEFRTTIMKEYHTAEDMDEIGKFIKGAPLYVIQKFNDSGNCIDAEGISAHSKEIALSFAAIMEKYVDKVELRYN